MSVATTRISPSESEDPRQAFRAAIAEYFGALNRALRTPDTAPTVLAPKIADTCSCRRILDVLAGLAKSGHYLDYRYSVSDVRIQQVGPRGGSATYVVTQSAGHKRRQDGSVADTFSASKARYSVHFRREPSGWVIDRSDVMK